MKNTQASINDNQGTINRSQTVINDDQNEINDKTKVNLSIKEFYTILVTVIGFVITITSFYFMTVDMKKDIAYIKAEVTQHKDESKELSARMTQNVKARDAEISKINTSIAIIKSILKIQ